MTVGDLKRELGFYPDDMPVHMAFDSGDYWHTTATPEIKHLEKADVRWLEYHRKPVLAERKDYEETKEVLVLSNSPVF